MPSWETNEASVILSCPMGPSERQEAQESVWLVVNSAVKVASLKLPVALRGCWEEEGVRE